MDAAPLIRFSQSLIWTALASLLALGCPAQEIRKAASEIAEPASADFKFARPDDDLLRIVTLIERRLALMPEVAAAKWHAGQPVYDAAREEIVLEQTVRDAEALRLDPAASRRLFDVQIRMARAIQTARFAQWRDTRAPQRGRDLATQLRPALDDIGAQLLTALYVAAPDLKDLDPTKPEWNETFVSIERLAEVFDLLPELRSALAAMRPAGRPGLGTIRKAGVLRIGMTGDYAPFSSDAGGVLRGFDVALGVALARHLGVAPRFVRTQWSTLSPDLQVGRFDVAMSGISVTAERSAIGSFSLVYHSDGKTPIVRCDEAKKFASLELIDRPGVRVVVNPGGTNERFVRDTIKQAPIVVHDDNRTIFAELLAGRADVMFTDGIEVQLQSRRHPELCGALAVPLTQASKAIMMPKDPILQQVVDSWLRPQLQSGEVRLLLERSLLEAR